MVILDRPYVSYELKCYLDDTQLPVLSNASALRENAGHNFNLISKEAFLKLYKEKKRLYTLSENSLDFVFENIDDKNLIDTISLMKDKYALRQKLKPLYQDFFFEKVSFTDLKNYKVQEESLPLILKPNVGFFSMGVYKINDQADMDRAVLEIEQSNYNCNYTSKVINKSEFILEQYIDATEFAIDAYYNEKGEAVVLNVLKHDFKSQSDVSDRLYYTSKDIILEYAPKFEKFLNEVNELLGITNFPFHVEVRVGAQITPIEFNPLRFCGCCCTDISHFAYNFYSFDYFFKNKRPNWEEILKDKGKEIYSFIVLNKEKTIESNQSFNYDKLKSDFKNVLCLRKVDYNELSMFGVLFAKTQHMEELNHIKTSDLTEYYTRGERFGN